jgi:CMP/dCMP kinase
MHGLEGIDAQQAEMIETPVREGVMSGGNHVDNRAQFVIAIDGPAASGKSTVAAAVADKLDALLFDTGAIYRALTLVALGRGVSPNDEERLTELIDLIDISIATPSQDDGRMYDIYIDGEDVTWAVRSPEVDRAVSAVSAHPGVRDGLLALQRSIGRSGRVIMPGRDIGTVVMPDAELKIWLDASIGERARRRQAELAQRDIVVTVPEVREEMHRRDQQDASRAQAPMEAASDAIVINTDGRDVDDVVKQIVQLATLIPGLNENEGGGGV